MRDHQDPFLKEQDCKGLICCLEALQSLDLTYYSIQNKNKNPIILYLEKRKVSNLINVANYILHAASIHATNSNIASKQILLAKYLYRFRYFYRIREFGSLKYQTSNKSSCSSLDINNIAIEALFLLVKY